MSDSFQRPEHPLSNHRDPFRDDSGRNPFADGGADEKGDTASEDEGDSVYATPDLGDRPQPQSGDFHETLHSRGGVVLWLGIAGGTISLLSWIGLAATLFGRLEWLQNAGITEFLPISFLGFGFALAAWNYGGHDLRAMKLGAMNASRQTATKVGYQLGVASVIISLVVYLSLLVFSVINMNFS